MANKLVTLKKQIGSEVFDLMVATIASQVQGTYNGTTTDLDTILATILSDRASQADFTALKTSYDTLTAGASETYDTLKEIGDYITTHTTEYEALLAISGNKVDKVDGMGLSTNDFTTELQTKLTELYTKAEIDALIATVTTSASDAATAAAAAQTTADSAVTAAATAQSAAEAAQATADANATAISTLETTVASSARIIVSATQPADLTENDLWFEDTTTTTA